MLHSALQADVSVLPAVPGHAEGELGTEPGRRGVEAQLPPLLLRDLGQAT